MTKYNVLLKQVREFFWLQPSNLETDVKTVEELDKELREVAHHIGPWIGVDKPIFVVNLDGTPCAVLSYGDKWDTIITIWAFRPNVDVERDSEDRAGTIGNWVLVRSDSRNNPVFRYSATNTEARADAMVLFSLRTFETDDVETSLPMTYPISIGV